MYIQLSEHHIEIVSSPPPSPSRVRTPRKDASAGLDTDSDEELPTVDELFAMAARQRDEQLALNAALRAKVSTPPPQANKRVHHSPLLKKKRSPIVSSPLRLAKEVYMIKKRATKLGKSKVTARWSPRLTPKAKLGAPLDFRGAMAGVWKEPNFIRKRELDAGRGWALDAHPRIEKTYTGLNAQAAANQAEEHAMQTMAKELQQASCSACVAGEYIVWKVALKPRTKGAGPVCSICSPLTSLSHSARSPRTNAATSTSYPQDGRWEVLACAGQKRSRAVGRHWVGMTSPQISRRGNVLAVLSGQSNHPELPSLGS
ncbi:hypothetical protein P7C70_g6740, partial [Phenoliferia sp. Uapishka_3]